MAQRYAELLSEHRRVSAGGFRAARRRRGRHAGRRVLRRVRARLRRDRGRLRRAGGAPRRPDQRAHGAPHGRAARYRGGLRRHRRPPRGADRRRRARRAGPPLAGDARPRRRRRPFATSASTGSRTSRRPSASSSSATATFRPEDALPDEPARPGDAVPRPRARARRGRRPAAPRGRSPADAHRPRRDRQDAARAPSGGRGRRGRSPTASGGSRSPPLRDPALVARRLAQALGAGAPGFTLEETLVDALAAKRALLLIDNAEHLLPQVASEIARLRESAGRAARDEPRAASAAGRARMPVPPLDDARRRLPCSRRARGRSAGVHADAGDRASSARGSTTCRWRSSSRPRASPLLAGAVARPARGRLDLLRGGPRRRPAPADPGRDDRAGRTTSSTRGRAAAVRAPCGLRGRLHATRRPRTCARRTPDTLQSLIDKSLVRSREAAGGDGTGCWRRSASSRPPSSKRPARPTH